MTEADRAGSIVSTADQQLFEQIDEQNCLEVVSLFIRQDNVNYQHPENNCSLLHIATELGCVEAIELLLRCGANPYVRDKFGQTPLHFAVDADLADLDQVGVHISWRVVGVFAKFGLNWQIPTFNGETPIDWVRQYGEHVCSVFLDYIGYTEQ